MGFFNSIKKKVSGNSNPEYKKKQYLLKHLTSKEVEKLEVSYYGKKLKFYWMDENDIERSRLPSRVELANSISLEVPTEIILSEFPKLKELLKQDDN